MIELFYVKINLQSELQDSSALTEKEFAIAQLITRIHRSANGIKFGLSYPELGYRTESAAPCLGTKINIFCKSKIDLAKILDSSSVRRHVRDNFEISPIRSLKPNLYSGWERFVRDRSMDKSSPSSRRRAVKRAKTFGRPSDNLSNFQNIDRSNTLPFFEHLSNSTGTEESGPRMMKVFIRREPAVEPNSFDFNSFGLSNQEQEAGASTYTALPILKNFSYT